MISLGVLIAAGLVFVVGLLFIIASNTKVTTGNIYDEGTNFVGGCCSHVVGYILIIVSAILAVLAGILFLCRL